MADTSSKVALTGTKSRWHDTWKPCHVFAWVEMLACFERFVLQKFQNTKTAVSRGLFVVQEIPRHTKTAVISDVKLYFEVRRLFFRSVVKNNGMQTRRMNHINLILQRVG